MKLYLLGIVLLSFSFSLYSQNFQPGYFINNDGKKTTCLIDNAEAIINPHSFQYKLSQGGETKEKTIREVQVFEILDSPYKFERAVVNLDISQDNLKEIDTKRQPNFRIDTLFLQVSIIGKASLYSYRSNKLPKRFFFSLDGKNIEPLIHKKYLIDETKIGINDRYKQQLLNNLECSSLSKEQISNSRYNQKSLNKIFAKYNSCKGDEFENFYKKRRKGIFNLAIKAGVNYSAIYFVQEYPFPNEQETDSYFSPRVGIELEYIFPSLNNKFAVISYPSFQYSKTSNETLIYKEGSTPSNPDAWAGEREDLLIDYSRIILPLGIRYYYLQGKSVNLYLQGAAALDILTNASKAYNLKNFNSDFNFEKTTANPYIDISTGVKFKKMSLDVSYSINNSMRNEDFNGNIKNSITLNFGYKIL